MSEENSPIYPVMRGRSVILARLRQSDLNSIIEPLSNLELTTYLMGWGRSNGEAEQREWLETHLKNTETMVHFGIYRQDALIGGVALRDISHRQGTAELGIALYRPEDWGRGYGSEATRLMCEYGGFHLGLYNILLKVFAFNERAVSAYKKVGFREIGRRSGSVRLGKERFDEVYMELLTETLDYAPLRAQLRQLDPLPPRKPQH